MSKTIYELHFTVGKFTGTHTVVRGRGGRRVSLADRETNWFVRVFDGGEVRALPETRASHGAIAEYAQAMLPGATCRTADVSDPDFGARGVCP